MFFRRSKAARGGSSEPFPDAWRQRLDLRWPLVTTLRDDERARLESLIQVFLGRIRFEAAQGFTVTEEMELLVAAQACLLLVGLDDPTLDLYSRLTSVILHPRTVVLKGAHHVGGSSGGLASDSAQTLSGQAVHRGPVVLAWSTLAFEARHHERGQNVVMHEFAHQLDMSDGMIDGTPPIRDRALRARWIEVCTAEFRRVRRGDETALRGYAATDTGEFFAVATETFFTRGAQLAVTAPDLYEVLQRFYGQDPAGRSVG